MTPEEIDALPGDYWSLHPRQAQLRHQDVVAALGLDDLRDPEHFMSWLMRWKASGTLTVYGWTRKVVSDADIDSMAAYLTEAFHEHWCDALELGNPEDFDANGSPEPEWLRAAITNDMRKRPVWQCEQTHQIELTPDEVIAIARRARFEFVRTEETKP